MPPFTRDEINEEFSDLPINLMVYHVEDVDDAFHEKGSFTVQACIIPDPVDDDPYDVVDEHDLSCEIVFPPQVTAKEVADAILTVLKCPHGSPLSESNGCTECMARGNALIRQD